MATWTGGLNGELPGVSRVRPFLASDDRPLGAPGFHQGFIFMDLGSHVGTENRTKADPKRQRKANEKKDATRMAKK